MVAQGDGRGKESLEGWFLYIFRSGTLVARIKIFIEERTKIDLVEGILFGLWLGNHVGLGCGCIGRLERHRRPPVVVKTIRCLSAVSRDPRLGRRRAIHCFEDGLIGGLGGALGFENGLHFLGG